MISHGSRFHTVTHIENDLGVHAGQKKKFISKEEWIPKSPDSIPIISFGATNRKCEGKEIKDMASLKFKIWRRLLQELINKTLQSWLKRVFN